MLLSSLLTGSANLHKEAVDWHNRVLVNGGRVSNSTLKAVSNFCRRIEVDGLRDKFLRLNLFCGSDLNACFTPLYRGLSFSGTKYGNSQDTNNGPFVSGDYTETGSGGGLSGNNSGGFFLDTGLDSATPYSDMSIAYNNFHGSVYLSNLGTTDGWMGGTIEYSLNNYIIAGFASAGDYAGVNIFYWESYGNYYYPYGSTLGNTTCAVEGLIVGNFKTSNNIFSIENNNCTGESNIAAPTGSYYGTSKMYIMRGPGGVLSPDPEPYYNSTDDTVAGYSIGVGLTSSELTSYYNAMNSFQDDLGRSIS